MKKIYFLLILSLFLSQTYAQWVTIPDANFAAFLQQNYPSCMNGNQMDTTCPTVLNLTNLYCNNKGISDLDGIQYFTSLLNLNCSFNNLTFLPQLPYTLTTLNCGANQLTSLPSLPPNLTSIDCAANQLNYLPTLPSGLLSLVCYSNPLQILPALPNNLESLMTGNNTTLTSLPSLPSSLKLLGIDHSNFSVLPVLPNSLEHLFIDNSLISNIPPLPSNLRTLYCNNNNSITSLPNLPDSLRILVASNNPLSNLPVLPDSLQQLECDHCQLTSLPTLPNSLKSIKVSNNQISILPNLPSFLNHLEFSYNQISAIPTLPNKIISLIADNNSINALPPFPPSLKNNIHLQYNQLFNLPELPDTIYYLRVNNNPNLSCLPELKFISNLYFNGSAVQCLPNYGNVTFSNPPLSSFPLCDLFNQNGCNAYWNISGNVYLDINGNCIHEPNEQKLSNFKLQLYQNGNLAQQTYSSAEGLYSFDTDTGTFSYTVDTTGLPILITCPPSGFHNSILTPADSMDYNMDFAMQCKTGFDLGVKNIVQTAGQFFPANYATIKVGAGDMANFYGLNCATGISGTVTININGPVTYISQAPGALVPNVSGNTILTYNISDFGTVNFNSDFRFIIQTDTLAQAGSIICISVNVTPISGDNDTTNNTLQHCFTVVNSFDPNDKQVFPSGVVLPGHEWLTYKIRFQNTGTAPAQHIYILDTLDANLDVSTFTLLSYSHDNLTQVLGDVVKFNFPNINLPDSTNDEPNSHGYVQYKIKLNPGLPIGATISNTAYNFFDFNPPIATNTVVNQIYFLSPTITPNNLMLCPNESDTLWTQVYDTCQWYKDGNVVPGANNQYLVVDYFNDAGSQFMVEVDSAGVVAQSPPVLVDGWVFLPPFVIQEGDFTIGSMGEMIICPGETAYLILGQPYDTNIQWTDNGYIIPGANNDTLVVTQSGNYHVSGAPSTCPNFIQNLGVTIEVIVQGPPEPVITFLGNYLETQPGFINYQWYVNGIPTGTNTNTFSSPGPGMYTVIVTDANGCTAESQVFIISSVIETSFSGIINVNYNSITGTLQITRSKVTTETEIFVLDVLGRVIADEKMARGISELEIKLSNIKPGIYFVNLSEGSSVKFFVE